MAAPSLPHLTRDRFQTGAREPGAQPGRHRLGDCLSRALLRVPDGAWRAVLLPFEVFTAGRYRLAAAGTLVVEDGRVLLLERCPSSLLCVPGGLRRPWESLTRTATRETAEETGYTVRLGNCLGIYPGHDPRWRAELTLFQAAIQGGTEHASPEGRPVWRPVRECLAGLAFEQERIFADLIARGVLCT